MNDKTETAAIKAALGDELAHKVVVSSTKSMTGHMWAPLKHHRGRRRCDGSA